MHTRNSFLPAAIVILFLGAAGLAADAQGQRLLPASRTKAAAPPTTETVPVSTSSDAARDDFELGMLHREDLLFVDEGLDYFRQTVKDDPNFALGHATLAYFTTDPVETRREQALAIKTITHASPDERLMIRWLNGTKNGELVPAIAAMNDLLARYPNDKRLANLAAEWLCANSQAYERGEAVLVNLLKNDPKYFPALNNLAYCYALSGQPSLAPALMDRYVAALPKQPNPQDSYGEIMRMLGDYPAALDHYGKALQIDAHFNTSQVGIASTFALMGNQERARAEYLKAIDGTKERATQFDYRILWAMTYYRENQLEQGRGEYTKLAAEAHAAGLSLEEAEAYRGMALFNPDAKAALKDLDAAQAAMSEKAQISRGDRELELATILQTRAFIAARAGMPSSARRPAEALSVMAETSRSELIQRAYHSANGAAMLSRGEYAKAIPELQEDPQNPLSLQLLATAQDKAGHADDARKTLETCAAISDERVETALASPQARAALKRTSPTTAQTVPN
jgi:tetratricopeptide (TPR) repeat protein